VNRSGGSDRGIATGANEQRKQFGDSRLSGFDLLLAGRSACCWLCPCCVSSLKVQYLNSGDDCSHDGATAFAVSGRPSRITCVTKHHSPLSLAGAYCLHKLKFRIGIVFVFIVLHGVVGFLQKGGDKERSGMIVQHDLLGKPQSPQQFSDFALVL